MKPGSKSALVDRAAQTKIELQRINDGIKGLADEIRLQIHLGSMDLKERWRALEPRLLEAERYVDEVSDTSREALADLAKRFRELRDHLHQLRAAHATMKH